MINYGYLLHEAERTRNQAEQRQADALVGQTAAAVARRADSVVRLWMSLAASVRARGRAAVPGLTAGPVNACPPVAAASCRANAVVSPTRSRLAITRHSRW
jgi:hypothetical protein